MKRIPSDAIPGVHVLPFTQAPKYSPSGMDDVRGIVWHFAEGGGTDYWLTREDGAQGDNSCHIVVKYDGSIRQIVEFDDASWSLHWNMSGNYTDFGIFKPVRTREIIGSDPNRHIIAIEVEGFWKNGPLTTQRNTILRLAKYLEEQFPEAIHMGHRDFQDYKACPGPSLFTNFLPHHGRLTQENDMPGLPTTLPNSAPYSGTAVITKGVKAIRLHDRAEYEVPFTVTRVVNRANLSGDLSGPGYLVDLNGDQTHFIREGLGVTFTPFQTSTELAAALNAATGEIARLKDEIAAIDRDTAQFAVELHRIASELE